MAMPHSDGEAGRATDATAGAAMSLQLTQGGEDTPACSKAQQVQRTLAVDLQLENAFEGFSGSPALQQMSHLGVYLQDCDDERRQAEMIEVICQC